MAQSDLQGGAPGDLGGQDSIPTSITLNPGAPTRVAAGATQQFTATVLDQFGVVMVGAAVTYALEAGALGTINAATGLYTAPLQAPETAGTDTLTATLGGDLVSQPSEITIPEAQSGTVYTAPAAVGNVAFSAVLVTPLAIAAFARNRVALQISAVAGPRTLDPLGYDVQIALSADRVSLQGGLTWVTATKDPVTGQHFIEVGPDDDASGAIAEDAAAYYLAWRELDTHQGGWMPNLLSLQ